MFRYVNSLYAMMMIIYYDFVVWCQAVRFKTIPGRTISQVLRAIATKVALRELPHTMTSGEIVEYVANSGKTLDEWASKEYKHEFIL